MQSGVEGKQGSLRVADGGQADLEKQASFSPQILFLIRAWHTLTLELLAENLKPFISIPHSHTSKSHTFELNFVEFYHSDSVMGHSRFYAICKSNEHMVQPAFLNQGVEQN